MDNVKTVPRRMKSIIQQTGPDLMQVLEVIPDAVIVIDTDFNVRLVNAAFTTLTGVSRA